MADFSPENRNSAIWSGDARRIANKRIGEVWLEKTGQKPIDETIGDKENVQWGLRLQEPIARAVGDRLNIRLKELDIEGTHQKHPWMRSHFDYVCEDIKTLYEIKNYSAFSRDHYGENGSTNIPDGDLAQVIHEAAVFNVDVVNLCVLFGGQELCIYPINVEQAHKDVLIQQEAALWACIQTRTPPAAEHPDDLRAILHKDDGSVMAATGNVEQDAKHLRKIKDAIAALEADEATLSARIMSYMGTASVLVGGNGTLVTWKQAKGSKKFDAKAMQQALPDTYDMYVRDTPGSRRFLVK